MGSGQNHLGGGRHFSPNQIVLRDLREGKGETPLSTWGPRKERWGNLLGNPDIPWGEPQRKETRVETRKLLANNNERKGGKKVVYWIWLDIGRRGILACEPHPEKEKVKENRPGYRNCQAKEVSRGGGKG